ncbi:type II toxin-antitoxin system HicA family toxin [Sphingobacterium tabacisoli]|uniref:Type II toxin-antitoxin system HicA family toxin n=1 Tax=Sphingobacterium tabacisoli TaxID=2044855 RepID=A0ABW5L6D4_9SPHI|nr:type II toxin-antitoxin system HicA family toxin [Sphingobacterium tabacisoli]
MKYKELHRLVRRCGWRRVADGKHPIYEKDGIRYPVPFHGGRNVPNGLLLTIIKDLGLK